MHQPDNDRSASFLARMKVHWPWSLRVMVLLRSIQELPEDATWEDIQERINFVAGVRKGLRELDEGKGIPHERVREEFREWLSS